MSSLRKLAYGFAAVGLFAPSAFGQAQVAPLFGPGHAPCRPQPVYPDCRPGTTPWVLPPGAVSPVLPPGTMPPTTQPPTTQPPTTPSVPTTPSPLDTFAGTQPGLGGSGAFNFTPNVIGDLLGGSVYITSVNVKTIQQTSIPVYQPVDEPLLRPAPSEHTQPIYIPRVQRGAFKISENESPRPTTRLYFTYNYFDQVLNGLGGPDTPRIMLHQEVFGYEQAFLDRKFSLGIRVPYSQLVTQGPNRFSDTSLGDLTFISKGVILEDRDSQSLLSGGLVVTVPTGNAPFLATDPAQNYKSALLQPYLGGIWARGDFFVQGFSSLVVATDSRDVTFWSNDMSLGFFAYKAQGSVLSSVVPVFEAHLNTPLNHRGIDSTYGGFADQLTLLGGTHFYLYDRSMLSLAAGAPVTGPRPFSLQATLQFNCRF